MKYQLPTILGTGLFDSKKKFGNITVTSTRKVEIYEVEYFFEDGGTAIINGCEYQIKRNNILFSKPGDIRYSCLPFTCKYLHFSITDTKLISSLEGIQNYFPILETKKIDELFSDISVLFNSPDYFDNINANAKLISLLHLLKNISNEKPSLTIKAKKFIEENFPNELNVENIADICNVSVSYLHKLFKANLNITPGEYILNCRISAARDLLSNSNLSLNEILFRCGFNSQSYFSDCFKRKTGYSPKDYRNKFKYTP